MAYKTYRDYQSKRGQPASEPQTVDRLPAPDVEVHSRAILIAVIAAAKSDGHIDDRERALITDEIGKLSHDAQLQTWVESELARPLDPAQVAVSASTPEIASEMYLASLLIADDQSFMERSYLDELAKQLKLEPDLKTSLERQVQGSV